MAFRTASNFSHFSSASPASPGAGRAPAPVLRLTVIIWLCALIAPTVVAAAEVRDLRLWRAPDHTRLVFDLSAGVDYKLFTLDAPERVVIDIADSTLATRLGDIEFEDSPITGLRSATREIGRAHV